MQLFVLNRTMFFGEKRY